MQLPDNVVDPFAQTPSPMETAPSTLARLHPAHALPDELWAIVLSKITWERAWSSAKPLLLWRPGAARALQTSPPLLAQLLSSRHGDSALQRSTLWYRADVAAQLLEQCEPGGAAVKNALVSAAHRGHIAVLQLLLSHASDATWDLSDAVQHAAINGHRRATEMLLDQGVDEQTRTQTFCMVAKHGHMDIMQMLLQRGIDMLEALKTSAVFGYVPAVAMLLDAGVSLAGNNSMCLLMEAMRGREAVVQLLLQHGAGANLEVLWAEAVKFAAARGHFACVEMLLRHGAALSEGQMEVAVRASAAAGHADIAALLFFHGRARTRGAERQLAALLALSNQ